MAKQGNSKSDPIYNKWVATGYLDGIDEVKGAIISNLLELGEIAFLLQPDINSDTLSTGQGNIDFPKDDLLYEIIVDLYLAKDDPTLVINYSDIYSELKKAISQRGRKMFDLDQKGGDGQPYFDPVNQYCFKQWFLNYYNNKTGRK